MTAFAAIVSLTGSAPPDAALDRVASAMSAVTGAETARVHKGICTLLLSPLHSCDPPGPVTHPREPVTCVGQVLLEQPHELAAELGLSRAPAQLEIIAAAVSRWGEGCAQHFNGEYAFAAWDERSRSLVCARDGFGVRVLYAADAREAIVVSNVIDAVVAHPSTPDDADQAALLAFLATGGTGDSIRTAYRAVRAVPEGHTLTLSVDRAAMLNRHWRVPQPDRRRWSGADVVDGYRAALRAAVDDRIGSAPATIFLSGGVDSPTIAASATDCSSRLRALTVTYDRVNSRTETELARRAAQALSMTWSTVQGDLHDALQAEREGDVPALPVDEPALADWRATLARAATLSTVAIYGEDGDALFAPPRPAELLRTQSLPAIAIETLRMVLASGRLPYLGIRGRERLFGRPAPQALPSWLTAEALRLLSDGSRATLFGLSCQPLPSQQPRQAIQDRLIPAVGRDFAPTISPSVTRQRVEVRLPLLDTRVLRHVISVPPIPWCQQKHLARVAFRDRLPGDLLERPKRGVVGFNEALVNDWRRGPGRSRSPLRLQSIDPGWIDEVAWQRSVYQGSTNETMAAWRLLMADAWLARSRPSRQQLCTR